ncbi:gustatory receptor 36a isoform X1 [Anticarsia gemmatalis]|uniref:gustatory receptor 36a isoform X1 n=1 Tax=Anticarsia gemmatalis TaxID=129554 RepID=UPI003F76EC7A
MAVEALPVETPMFQKCCYCVPLRYGLIVWAIVKLLIDALMIYAQSDVIYVRSDEYAFIIIVYTIAFMASFDFIMNIVFIIGCCWQKQSIIKAYYAHTIFLLMLVGGFYVYSVIDVIIRVSGYKNLYISVALISIIFLVILFFHYHLLLLVRSQIVKLENNFENRTNDALEPDCTLKMEDVERQRRTE